MFSLMNEGMNVRLYSTDQIKKGKNKFLMVKEIYMNIEQWLWRDNEVNKQACWHQTKKWGNK